jgi:hypothetical protein
VFHVDEASLFLIYGRLVLIYDRLNGAAPNAAPFRCVSPSRLHAVRWPVRMMRERDVQLRPCSKDDLASRRSACRKTSWVDRHEMQAARLISFLIDASRTF